MLTLHPERTLQFHENYFKEFYLNLPENDREKIEYILDMIKKLQWIPKRFLKHIEGTAGLYEIRAKSGVFNYRIFCFFDSGSRVILLNGFTKKSQKTPAKELDLALNLMRIYKKNKVNRI
jgi:phage-related protein